MPVIGDAETRERMVLRLTSGATVNAQLLQPALSDRQVPAIVVLGAFDRGAAVVDLLPPAEDAALVGLDYPLTLPRQVHWQDVLPLSRRIEAGIADTIEALGALHSILGSKPGIDGARLTVAGISFGAPFAVMAAARYDYRGLVVVDGFGNVPGVIRWQFERRWKPRYGAFGTALAWLAQRAICLLVRVPPPEHYAAQLGADQDVLMVRAARDEFVPESSSLALLEALHRSHARLTVKQTTGSHVRGKDAQAVAQLYAIVRSWMLDAGLLPPILEASAK
jgi:dienelactone hydrolase